MIRGERDITTSLVRDGVFERDLNMVVRAGAGSGKTSVLVERMVALVRSGVQIDQLAAITFTRKAAGELRERFFLQLRQSASQLESCVQAGKGSEGVDACDDLLLEKERIQAALDSVERVFIDTIHAFSQRLLRERPFDAGLSPDFHVIDDREGDQLRRSYWNTYLNQALGSETGWIIRFEELGIQPTDFYDYFCDRCKFEHMPVRAGSCPEPDLSPTVQAVSDFLDRVQPMLSVDGRTDRFTNTVMRAMRQRRIRGLKRIGDRAAWLSLFDDLVNEKGTLKSRVIEPTKWSPERKSEAYTFAQSLSRDPAPGDPDRSFASFVLAEVRPVLTLWRRFLFDSIEQFVHPAVEGFSELRREQGRLTFDDLLRNAARMLRNQPTARQYFSTRYGRILVDEFQDTDPLQAEILFFLTAGDPDEKDWRKCIPGKGSLFIVGDDKQSIYRFRSAEIRVFDECARLLEASGGRIVHLKTNFRSDARLCDWNNRALSGLFEQSEATYQADFERLEPHRPAGTHSHAVLQLITEPIRGHVAAEVSRIEASRIAGIIDRMCRKEPITIGSGSGDESENTCGFRLDSTGRPVSYGDFMIMVRVSARMNIYAEALQKAGIPYTLSGEKALGQASSIGLLLDLLDTIFNPSDAIARTAFLRGSWAGVSDVALYRFVQAGGRLSGPYRLPDGLDEDDRRSFQDAFETLRAARALLETWPVSHALELILAKRGLLAGVALDSAGSSEVGALLRVLALLREWESGGLNWMEARSELHRMRDGDLKVEGMTLEVGRGEAVQLLNIHQAKGLQSRVVILADAAPTRGSHQVLSHVDRRGGGATAVLPVVKKFGFHSTILAEPDEWRAAQLEESRYSDAEADRLVYVAVTRAEELLVVARYAGNETRGVWKDLYHALDSENIPILWTDPAIATEEPESDLDDWIDGLEAVRASLSRAGIHTYDRIRVTDVREAGIEEDDFSDVAVRGRGRGYGRVVHRLFEWAVLHRHEPVDHRLDVERVAGIIREEDSAWTREELEDRNAQALEDLRRFRSSALWAEISVSKAVLTEVPFSVLNNEKERPTVVSGMIDLVYETLSGWKIVDYKTDQVNRDILEKKYSDQVRLYGIYWMDFVESGISELGLWSVHENQFITVEMGAQESLHS